MNHARVNRIIAAGIFVVTLLVYLMTLSPTVVFWDVGEFIAAAKLLQVPHPPGSPLFLLATRMAMMIPFVADQAVRAHALSACLSALGIMFFYLVIVRVITDFRGIPSTIGDRITVYGSAVVGALSLAFGTTFWDNAIEAEVYGASMFFLAVILWLAFRWLDTVDERGNEKYLLLIAYMIGLSLGIHLLALLAIFPVLMIIYFKKYEVTFNSLTMFAIVAIVVFCVVYPGIVKILPGMMDGEMGGKKSEVIAFIPWIVLALVCIGAYKSYKNRQKMLYLALMSMLLIFLGYSTYTSVIIRSNANPPMNENDPSNLAKLTSYLGREQYGNAPLFMPRRYSQEPHQQGIYANYTSDMDFLIRYQLNHMFFRYLFWNYAGTAGDAQDSGWSAKDTWGLPLLIGLVGLYFQFKKDWKMGLVFLTAFVIFGPMLALYQNQQEPQPRERDYFYVGAFLVFSTWIAVGVVALIDLLRVALNAENRLTLLGGGIVGVCAIAIPANFIRMNYHEHDRSGNYVAWDYSYNMLQTCEKDAILFTNGDNDTFPLWYLQDVEGVRRDVRIVNLSLVNTNWYVQQMKNKPYYAEAQAVPISLSDTRIANIQPMLWEPRSVDIPVVKDVYAKYGVTDTAETNRGKITFMMRNTLQFGQTRAIRVQDILVRNIIETNQWKRPIYFAVTCAPDSKIGLDDYLWFHGLAMRLEPRKISRDDMGLNPHIVEQNLLHEPDAVSRTPQYGYRFRGVNDPKVYFDENITRLMLNLRSGFIRLAMYYANVDTNLTKAGAALDRMEYLIPRKKIPMGWELESDLAGFYHRIGNIDKFNELSTEVENDARAAIEAGGVNMNSPYYNPYRALIDIYEAKKDYQKELQILMDLQSRYYPTDPALKARIDLVQQQANRASAPQQQPSQ